MENTLLFIGSTNILVRLLTVNIRNCLTPRNPKMCDPILVTLLKMRHHYSTNINHKGLQRTANEYAEERRIYSQSSRENAHPSPAAHPH